MVSWVRYGTQNFSGRSAALQAELRTVKGRRGAAFLGPFAETCLSGFAVTPRDEVALYGQSEFRGPWADLFARKSQQAISTLSGGEQVMLGVTVLAGRTGVTDAGVDCALEQLDTRNRALALDVLNASVAERIHLVDHRSRFSGSFVQGPTGSLPEAARRFTFEPAIADFILDLPLERVRIRTSNVTPESPPLPIGATEISLQGVGFSYGAGAPVFDDCTLTLKPGRVYRLVGENGTGKSTLFKLLCGLLRPRRGEFRVAGKPYSPSDSGNRLFGYAMQNPDEQWVATTLESDLRMRLSRLPGANGERTEEEWLRYFKMFDVDLRSGTHVLDYPRALRKRLSWYWALSGRMPWSVLDEPTLGQDDATVNGLGIRIKRLAEAGRGVVVVTHDDRLIEAMKPQTLRIAGRRIEEEPNA